ncbi:cytochrome c-type biogenesis protein CcmH [Polymorphobacter arshaanensis]|uniref:Cytochrome c-type biogenesis protein n=1 Tax=Glacieibacterium arshaanense TaxID=2511025 RepID=A0A4Y9EK16_9SPHN|nr:cytochrome c-type biogenesis protein [Polymorphobacter arshaanensis]TFU01122.1 cytochrome c-type biogenesis protein CcmH [Polymorphobacter arshaanensis]
MRALFLALLLLFAAPLAADPTMPPAALADTPLPDAAQEAKAQALMHELRCLVCQNQSIADSHADMAGDMRALVRSKIAAGESPDEVRAWLIKRYGDWVSFNPPTHGAALGLWLAPLLFLGVGLLLALRLFRRRGSETKA